MRAKRVLGLGVLAVVWIAGCSDGSSSGMKPNVHVDGDEDAGADAGSRADGGGSAMHPKPNDPTAMHDADASTGTGMDDSHDAAVHDPGTGTAGASHRVYFWGDFAQQNGGQLVAIDYPGGKKQVLPIMGKAEIDEVGVARDGSRVVITRSDADGDPQNLRAYATDDWSSPVMLDSVGADEEFGDVALSNDGSFVAYERETVSTGARHVYVAATDGSTPPVQVDASGDTDRLTWSPDGHLAFWDSTTLVIVDPAKPSSPKMVTTPDVISLELACDQQNRFYFPGAPDTSSSPRFYRVSVSGDVEMLAGSDQFDSPPSMDSIDRLAMSPDGTMLAFRADLGGQGFEDGFVLDLTSHAAPARLTDLMNGGQVHRLSWRPDSAALAISIEWNVPDGTTGVTGSVVLEPLDGSDPIQIDAPETAYQIEAEDLTYSPDGSRLYFRADGRTEGAMELFALDDLAHPPADPFAMVVQDSIADGDVDGLAITH